MKTDDVLGVSRNASNERIGTAFRKAAKACHPDLNAGDPTAELQIRQVIIAYEILKTPHKRPAYDRYLRERRRERTRPFAMAAVSILLPGSIVAVAVSLWVWQSNTQDVSVWPLLPPMVSGMVRPDASQPSAPVAVRK
jgi:curved DNA-binding protein CbpA